MEADKNRERDKSEKEGSRDVSDDGRRKQQDYFKTQLDHLRTDLKREASFIRKQDPARYEDLKRVKVSRITPSTLVVSLQTANCHLNDDGCMESVKRELEVALTFVMISVGSTAQHYG